MVAAMKDVVELGDGVGAFNADRHDAASKAFSVTCGLGGAWSAFVKLAV